MAETQFKVAAVQAVPVFMDLAGSVEKTVKLIGEAAGNGAKLVAFSEAWIPGFPFWAFVNAPFQGMPHFAAYQQNSLRVDSDEMRAIQAAANEYDIHVALGFSERGGDTLYLAQALIGDDGELVFTRRKLGPPWPSGCIRRGRWLDLSLRTPIWVASVRCVAGNI